MKPSPKLTLSIPIAPRHDANARSLGRSWARAPIFLGVIAALALTACDSSTAPKTGNLKVSINTVGRDFDADGYLLFVGSGQPRAVAGSEITVLVPLGAGTHELTLAGIADNCTLEGPPSRSITVLPGETATVEFLVTCHVRFDRSIAFQRDTIINGALSTAVLVALADGAAAVRLASGYTPAWSPDGKRLAYSNAACDFYYYLPCTGGLVILDTETGTESVPAYGKLGIEPSWSPDGKHIAFIKIGPYSDNPPTLHVSAMDGSPPVSLTAPGLREYHPSWSPDGQRIAFQCYTPPNQNEICAVNKDGSGYVQLTHAGGYNGWPAWSPDGSRIAFTTDRYLGDVSVALMKPDGSSVTQLTKGWEPAWSPDGSKLVFARADGLFTIASDGSGIARITNGQHRAPAWRPSPMPSEVR